MSHSLPANMRQAVIVAADRFEIREVPLPQIGPGEVLLRTRTCGICSGDLMPWYLARKVGTVLGHEPIGVAVAIGPGVTQFCEGDLVFAHHHAPCLDCFACRRRAFVHCPTWKRTALDPGGMADFIRVPAEIVRVDAFAVNDLTAEQALFIEPLGCCVKAFERVGCVVGRRVAVVGCGVMGLLNLQLARTLGAVEVFAIEPDPFRRQFAATLGATPLTPDEARTRLRHTVEVVVIGPGFPAVIREALDLVAPAGVACLFTPTATGIVTELDLGELYFRDVTLVTSYSCGPEDTRQAYHWLRSGKVVGPITHRFRLEEIQRAFDTAKAGGAAIKVIVTFAEEDNS